MSDDSEVLLTLSARGDKTAADRLVPRVHDALRGLAEHYFRGERAGHTLQPTALINEAYLRLIHHRQLDSKTTTHFFALAAGEMRRVLIDHARGKQAAKRGGGHHRVPLDLAELHEERVVDSVDLQEALDRLAELDPRMSKVAELRLFGGLNEKEVAEAVGVAPRTVREDWRTARAWLRSELEKGDDA